MRIWQRISKRGAIKVIALATVLAVATVAPGGAFVAALSGDSSSEGFGGGFDAFVGAMADEPEPAVTGETETSDDGDVGTVEGSVGEGVDGSAATDGETTEAETTVEEQEAVQDVVDAVEEVGGVDLGSLQLPDLDDTAAEAAAQEQQLSAASTADVIAALLALLTSAQPQVLHAIDLGEAAVIAKLDAAKVQIIAAFANVSMPELQAFALQQIEAAKVLIGQVFDQIRALVIGAFAQARDAIIKELTGIDFGDAVDDVLAKIATIQTWAQQMLTGVQALLEDLGAGLPLPIP